MWRSVAMEKSAEYRCRQHSEAKEVLYAMGEWWVKVMNAPSDLPRHECLLEAKGASGNVPE